MSFPEPDLPTAAENCFSDLYPLWLVAANPVRGIKPTGVTFCALLKATFPSDQESAFPCTDLLAIAASQFANLPAPDAANIPTEDLFVAVTETIYKLLWMAEQLSTQSPQQISSSQAAEVLAAYNTAFDV